MLIEATRFNYGAFMDDQENTGSKMRAIHEGRKNLLLQNKRYTIFGEVVDKDNRIMMLKDISLKRDYMTDSKQNIVTDWDNYLSQFAEDEPEQIAEKREKMNEAEKKREDRAAFLEELKAEREQERAEREAKREAQRQQREVEKAHKDAEREAARLAKEQAKAAAEATNNQESNTNSGKGKGKGKKDEVVA